MTDPTTRSSLRLDLDAYQAVVDGEPVPLTPNEVALLRHLVEHQGQAVTREDLHTEVFGYSPKVVSRAADYAVHRLRRKLEADPSAPIHLLTVPGVGFRFVEGGPGRRGSASLDPDARGVLPPDPAAGDPAAGDPAADPVAEAARLRLPIQTTLLVGREEEARAVLSLLEGGARLVTLVGPAGVGKTRLACSVGAAWFASRGQPVAFCDLARVKDGAAIPAALARDLGWSDALPAHRLTRVLAARPQLLVLDNVEQILGPVSALVQDWLQAAPELLLLLTSRERTRAPGEHIVEVPPLSETDSVALFVDRARMARSAFSGEGEDEAAVVRRLVRLLDCLPLAIELAAARSPVLSPAQMLERLERSVGVASAPRGAPARQATLADAFGWSWELLSGEEQEVLAQLTAFRTGFDVDDAEAVVCLSRGTLPLVDHIQALREKSLLTEVGEHSPPRFGMLRAVRELAEPRCVDRPGLWRRHADWVLAATTGVAQALLRSEPTGSDRLVALDDDVHAALDRLTGQDAAVGTVARLLTVAHEGWLRTGTLDGYLDRVDALLATADGLSDQAWIWLHLARLRIAQPRGGPGAPASCAAVLSRATEVAQRPLAAAARLHLASHHHQAKRLDEALAELELAGELIGDLPPGALSVRLHIQRGNVHIEARRFDEADRCFRRAAAVGERAGISAFEPLIYLNRAVLRGWQDQPREQAAMARHALLGARAQGQDQREVRALLMLALAEGELGALDDARRHALDAATLAERRHNPTDACDARVALAGIEFARGELDAVARHVRAARALQDHVRSPYHRAYIAMWDGLACWARWGSLDESVALLQEALAVARGRLPTGELQIESRLLAARVHLTPDEHDALATAWDDLERRAKARGLDVLLPQLALDRLHLDLAAAAAGRTDAAARVRAALDPAPGDAPGIQVRWSRMMLASALAEHPAAVDGARRPAGS